MDEKREGEYLQVYLDAVDITGPNNLMGFTEDTNTILKSIANAGGTVVERNVDYEGGRFIVRIIYTLPAGVTLSET